MGSEGVLIVQGKAKDEGGIVAALDELDGVSIFAIIFKRPGSAEFTVGMQGAVIPSQLYAACAWLERVDRDAFPAHVPDDAPAGAPSQVSFEFSAPAMADYKVAVGGIVTSGQLDVAERWLVWKVNTDFAIGLQTQMQAQMQNQRLMQSIGQRGLGRTH